VERGYQPRRIALSIVPNYLAIRLAPALSVSGAGLRRLSLRRLHAGGFIFQLSKDN
jgi:hypothetical protein